MRILWSWLNELVEISESPEAVAERLTEAGLEVEEIQLYRRLAEPLKEIVVGEVIQVERHPSADRLWVCRVRIVSEKELQIVTAASNLYRGAKVPVALPGNKVKLEGRWTPIQPRTFRGILSEGMLCSEAELGLGNHGEDIFLLPAETKTGISLVEVLEDFSDTVLEVSVTPNRGDALSHLGIARDYAALTGAKLSLPSLNFEEGAIPFPFFFDVPLAEAVPRYGGLYITNLKEGPRNTPAWIRHRLEAVGMRPIHPVVDITNYVLVGFGQPLHAFDADRIEGNKLTIVPLSERQVMTSLQGEELMLQPGDIVIADAGGPACLGGVIGGKRTAVTPMTSSVFLESAYFAPPYIRRTARRLGIHTESAYRFMRGTDPNRVPWAALYAASLIQSIYPLAKFSSYTEFHSPPHTAPYRFTLSLSSLNRIIGLKLSTDEVLSTLEKLEIRVNSQGPDSWEVEVPRYRLDVTREVDIAEELLRINGWETLPLPSSQPTCPYTTPTVVEAVYEFREAVSEFLTGMGLWEIRTNSLVGSKHFFPEMEVSPVCLANPLYEEVAFLRPNLAGSGLEVIVHNRNHGARGFWAYEWGKVYYQGGEESRLGLWGWGRPPQVMIGKEVPSALHVLIALVRGLWTRLGLSIQETPLKSSYQGWREGFLIHLGGEKLGAVGTLREDFVRRFGLGGEEIVYAEISLSPIERKLFSKPTFRGISYQPIVVKDLSIFVPSNYSYSEIIEALCGLSCPYLIGIEPFDYYIDEGGRRSYGLRFYLQGDHTLTEEEIHGFLRDSIKLLEGLGVKVRKSDMF
ncbi:MAG: phenylalanine--tRNA ligase subunit beta [Bacteroidia bacterium]|nr:phenylalanine--tRNA ligase subunit beta [Bacteroidia bacterium]MDW8134390.1 phenylalanine--tRNA ligase subunit beta [Bacteroidia bacterium]